MTDLPEPLTPADCDLRDFKFMPLDVSKLRDSDLAAQASGDEFRAAVLLWCASWHQIPAGSLPNDEKIISNLCGFGRAPKEWKRIRAGALHGFILCSDGRLYHPTVCEKATEAWSSRGKFSEKREKDRERLKNWREQKRNKPGEGNETETGFRNADGNEGETRTKPLREGQGTGDSSDTNVSDVLPENPIKDDPPAPADPSKLFWDDAMGYLGGKHRALIGRWVRDYGIPHCITALKLTKAENEGRGPDSPVAFMTRVLQVGAEREAARIEAERKADADFNRRFPPRFISPAEAAKLFDRDKLAQWLAETPEGRMV